VTGPSDEGRAAAREPRGQISPREDVGPGDGSGSLVAKTGSLSYPTDQAVPEPAGRAKTFRAERRSPQLPAYGALDLGTNNCRLLVARPSRRGFYVIDAFSRIIRLGEGVSRTGELSTEAMDRTIEALKVCSDKMRRRRVRRSRVIATEACRVASNSAEFIDQVKERTGLELEVVSRETEAKLAVSGCASLLDAACDFALVFDIGGGSSELIWLDLSRRTRSWRRSIYDRLDSQNCIAAWTSLPLGVVTLAERHGGRHVTPDVFEAMIADVMAMLEEFEDQHGLREKVKNGRLHLLGTSGTVTTIAGIHLELAAYDRKRVDGCWLRTPQVQEVADSLIGMSYEERVAQPCVGRERADLVLAGCAILEAMLRMWPCERLRVADRGLREGILATLMAEDGYPQARRRRRARRK
jgi:exopolyphosphatase/guanosine-5'-triphosphate,3'-diphosphate pyrophosphatase